MSDKVFIDTNILVYASLLDDPAKHERSILFLDGLKGSTVFISTQVMGELSVALLKHQVTEDRIIDILEQIAEKFNVSAITLDTVMRAWKVKQKRHFSYWDSLIVASALDSDCTQLVSENLQDGQIIDRNLRIVNPFTL